MKQKFHNILVIRTDRIGDVVLTTPAIKALREHFPESKIAVMISPNAIDLLEGNECVDEILLDDRFKTHRGLSGFLRLVMSIRRRGFDVVFVLHTKRRTNLACFLAGIPLRIGYKNDKFGFLLNRQVKDIRPQGKKHETEYCLDILKEIGIESRNESLCVPVHERSLVKMEQVLRAHSVEATDRLIAVHAGASDPSKRWPEKYFAELIDRIVAKYPFKIILIGGTLTQEISARIKALVHCPLIDLTGQTTVGEIAALLSKCSLLVSNDSGPVHVAAGVGTPVVSIFTRNQPGINPERWKPVGVPACVVTVNRSESQIISFEKAGAAGPKYLELIEVTEVLEAVDGVFKLC